jgi:AcrR family transcriptional regulator
MARARVLVGTEPVEKSAATRGSIMLTARDMFARDGYTSTSIANIAYAAGTSVGLIYYHFGSKKELFYAIWNEYQEYQSDRVGHVIGDLQEGGVDDGAQLLLAGCRTWLVGAWECRLVYRMAHHRDTPPGFSAASTIARERWMRRYGQILDTDDLHLNRVALIVITSSLDGLCTEIARCRARAEAMGLVERAMAVLAGLIEAYRRAAGAPVA